jgi:proteasome lid subunit RPN8/RPN11
MSSRCPVLKPWQKSVMFRAIKEARDRDREHGFIINEDGELQKYCEGNKCGVLLENDGERQPATYHTHPSGAVNPSDQDLILSVYNYMNYFCIGGTHEAFRPTWGRVVKCYVREDTLDPSPALLKTVRDWATSDKYVPLGREERKEILNDHYGLHCSYWQDGVTAATDWNFASKKRESVK